MVRISTLITADEATGLAARRVVSISGGILVSAVILFGISQAGKTGITSDAEPIQDLRAVALEVPPPPPPSAPDVTPVPPRPIELPPQPTGGSIPVVAAPFVPDVPAPSVSFDFAFTPDAFKPDMGGTKQADYRVYQRYEVDRVAVVLHRKKPDIPRSLIDQIRDPRVTLLFVVNQEGRVEKVRLLRSAHPEFDRLVMEAIEQWRFRPALKNGEPVRQWVQLPVYVKARRSSPFSVD